MEDGRWKERFEHFVFAIFHLQSSIIAFPRKPRPDFLQNQPARLLRRQVRVVDDLCAERHHQRRNGALAVALVARGEIFIHAVGGAAARALLQFCVEIELEIRFGKDIRADVAAFHHQIAEFEALALAFDHPLAHLRHGGDVRHGGAGFGGADFLFGIITADEQARLAQAVLFRADQFRFPFAAGGGDGLGVIHVNPLPEAMPGERAIHRAGVHINIAERLGDELRIRALAAGARAINGDDNGFSSNSILHPRPAFSSSKNRLRGRGGERGRFSLQTIPLPPISFPFSRPKSSHQDPLAAVRRVSGKNSGTSFSRTRDS